MKARIVAGCGLFLAVGIWLFAGELQPKEVRDHFVLSEQLDEHGDAMLSMLGFDDDGDLTTPGALEVIEGEIRTQQPRILIFFVHGWKNDGSKENLTEGDLRNFRAFLESFSAKARANQTLSFHEQHRIYGVYLAWHGHSRSYLQNLTFWDRRDVSEGLGQSPAFLGAIRQLTRVAKEATNDSRPPVRVIAAGHSMGGRVLNAVLDEQLRAEELLQPSTDSPDMWLMINPASTHAHLEGLQSEARSIGNEADTQCVPPRVVFASSKSDDAIGRWYRYATLSRGIGHDGLKTHEISPIPPGEVPQPSDCRTPPDDAMLFNLLCNEEQNQGVVKITPELTFELSEYPIARTLPGYWVISLPEAILDGHSGFFSEPFQAFAAALFRLAKPHAKSRPCLPAKNPESQ